MRKYIITVDGKAMFDRLLYELAQWHEKRFTVVGNSIVTSNNNVIDIATETFLYNRHFLHITEEQSHAE